MSVVKSKRGEGKLVVITKARELAKYTLKICANENNFPKRYRWSLTNKIVDSAMTIHNSANMANSIYIYDDNDYVLRKRYQTIALAETYALLGMIDIAFDIYGLTADRVEYWTRLCMDVQALLRNWRKADKDNYEKSKEQTVKA